MPRQLPPPTAPPPSSFPDFVGRTVADACLPRIGPAGAMFLGVMARAVAEHAAAAYRPPAPATPPRAAAAKRKRPLPVKSVDEPKGVRVTDDITYFPPEKTDASHSRR